MSDDDETSVEEFQEMMDNVTPAELQGAVTVMLDDLPLESPAPDDQVTASIYVLGKAVEWLMATHPLLEESAHIGDPDPMYQQRWPNPANTADDAADISDSVPHHDL